MSDLILEAPATCPYCAARISITIDTSVAGQEYVEDCPVCCQPMRVSYTAAEGEVLELDVTAEP